MSKYEYTCNQCQYRVSLDGGTVDDLIAWAKAHDEKCSGSCAVEKAPEVAEPGVGRECCPGSGVRRHDFAPDDWNGTPESCELCNHGPGHPIHRAATVRHGGGQG